ncbi:MAG: hypothetical protein IKN17_12860 [Ruminococcus sp.]|nr:hypothetical protein [Ruminococcus sp.]
MKGRFPRRITAALMALFMFGSILPSGSGLFTAFAKLVINEKDPTVPHSISVECVNPEGGTATLRGHSLSLAGDIGVNFYMELSDKLLADETAKMVFNIPNGSRIETKEILLTDVTSDPDSKYDIEGHETYRFTASVAAKDMTRTVTAQIVSDNYIGKAYEYSIYEYAQYIGIHRDDYSTETVKLADAMSEYGLAADIYFDESKDIKSYPAVNKYLKSL